MTFDLSACSHWMRSFRLVSDFACPAFNPFQLQEHSESLILMFLAHRDEFLFFCDRFVRQQIISPEYTLSFKNVLSALALV